MMKSEVMMPDVQRRRYTDDFKMEAVRLMRESNRPTAQAARDLGIANNLLYRWVAEHQQAEVQGTTRAALRTDAGELARVKRELEGVTKERDFYDVRRRSSRRSPDEISRDPRERPPLSHPAHVPRARGLARRLLRLA